VSTWTEYVRLARRLDELATDAERTAADTSARRELTIATVAHLDQRLADQRARLDHLGRAIGQRVGPPPATFTGVTDPGEAVRLAGRYADEADAATAAAERQAQQPALLPGVAPRLRNVLTYGACALLAVAAQYALLLAGGSHGVDSVSLFAWSCAGFPAMAWIAGYLVLSVWGRPRVGDPAVERSPRIGFAICFLAMPLAYCAFRAVTSASGL